MEILIIKNEEDTTQLKQENKRVFTFNSMQFFQNSESDYDYHTFLDSISKKKYSHIILIGEEEDEQILINLACHIRFTPEFKTLFTLPIILLGSIPFDAILKYQYSSILLTKGIQYCYKTLYDSSNPIEYVVKSFLSKTPIQYETFCSENIRNGKFSIHPPTGSSHQIANEWGAYRLAEISGLTHLQKKIREDQEKSKTLYFKFLRQKFKLNIEQYNIPETLTDQEGKFLLIDDNYKKGWDLVLSELLKSIYPKMDLHSFKGFEKIESNEEEVFNQIIDSIAINKFKIIFLDLRLTKKEYSKKFDNVKINKFSAARLLKKIKENFPATSVIIFTASNKAWNFEQLNQLGADGYYIKENPETFISQSSSQINYNNLITTTKLCLEKHTRLLPFFEFIKSIEANIIVKERNLATGNRTEIKKRICERLWMSFGLIKRNFEDNDFNSKTFYYSDLELSFITLWSCFIDIQFIYYKKDLMWETNSGKEKRNIKIESFLITKLGLVDNHDLDIYLQKKKPTARQFLTRLKVDYNLPSNVYQLDTEDIGNKEFSQNIGEQIAFLILSFKRGQNIKSHSSTGIEYINSLVNNLVTLKEKRNELYLIHGDEKELSDYFTKIVRDSSRISLVDCKQLFEIVYFLLTGEIRKMT